MSVLTSLEVGSHDADVAGFWGIGAPTGLPSIALVVSAATNALTATLVLSGGAQEIKQTAASEVYVTQSASAAGIANSPQITVSYTPGSAGPRPAPDTCMVNLEGGIIQVGPTLQQNSPWYAYDEPAPPPATGVTLPARTFGPIAARSQDGSQHTQAWIQLNVDPATNRLESVTFFRADQQTYPMVLDMGTFPLATIAYVPSGSLTTATDAA